MLGVELPKACERCGLKCLAGAEARTSSEAPSALAQPVGSPPHRVRRSRLLCALLIATTHYALAFGLCVDAHPTHFNALDAHRSNALLQPHLNCVARKADVAGSLAKFRTHPRWAKPKCVADFQRTSPSPLFGVVSLACGAAFAFIACRRTHPAWRCSAAGSNGPSGSGRGGSGSPAAPQSSGSGSAQPGARGLFAPRRHPLHRRERITNRHRSTTSRHHAPRCVLCRGQRSSYP